MNGNENARLLSNRDRFFNLLAPIFESSEWFEVRKTTEKKNHEKKIEILYKGTQEQFCHIWCHQRRNRLDLLIPNTRILKIPDELGLQTSYKDILKGVEMENMLAASFQNVEEDVLIEICKYIESHKL